MNEIRMIKEMAYGVKQSIKNKENMYIYKDPSSETPPRKPGFVCSSNESLDFECLGYFYDGCFYQKDVDYSEIY